MRSIHIALPVIALLLSGGATLAATATAPTTTTTAVPATSSHHHLFSAAPTGSSAAQAGTTQAGTTQAGTTQTATAATAKIAPTATGAGKFTSESQATQACGAGNVVWANSSTKAFHLQGDQYFGHTKHGAFMCQATATAGGFHLAGHKANASKANASKG